MSTTQESEKLKVINGTAVGEPNAVASALATGELAGPLGSLAVSTGSGPQRSVERQEEIVSILYRFVEAQKANPPDLIYYSARDGNKRHSIYSPAVGQALEQIMALFGYAVTPIE